MTRRQNRGPIVKFVLGLPSFVFFAVLSLSTAKISDKRLCFDEECSVVISKGKTTLPYNSKDHDVLSFPANVDVKIFSKAAGDRKDLWGVEIKGQRGYAPLRFIREYQILESNLKFEVSTEEFYNKKNVNIKEEIETSNNNILNSVEESHNEASNNDLKGEIIPSHVSQPYEFEYDGTILPQENEVIDLPSFNYSAGTVQDNIKVEEQVRLNVFPTILSSMFSGSSDILNDGDEDFEESNIESSSLDETVAKETINKTPEIEKTDESNHNSEINSVSVSNNEIFGNKEKELLEVETNDVINNSEAKIIKQKEKTEDSEASDNHKIDNANSEEALENSTIEIGLIDSLISQDNIKESSAIEYVSHDESSNFKFTEEEKSVFEISEENVPKFEEDTAVDNLSNDIQNDIDIITPTNETILDKQKDVSQAIEKVLNKVEEKTNGINVTVNNINIESITSEVPLTEENEAKSVVSPNESFLPHSSSFQSNLSEYEVFEGSSKNVDNTNESNEFIEKSNILNNNDNFQQKNNETAVESNDRISNADLPAYLKSESVIESTESSFQSTDSGQEHTVDIPTTSSFGEFLGNRNLLNAEKDSEEIIVNNVVNDNIQTISDGNKETLSTEVKEEEIINQEVPVEKSIEKIALPSETCDKNLGCSSDYARHQYFADENAVTNTRKVANNSDRFFYVCITAVTTLLFSLGYYFIQNKRRDAFLIGKINNLEKELMITRKECIMLDENFKSTKTKLDSIQDESFGSNEMVLSLKTELASSENTRLELEDQIALLEKELENTSEAGLELERMLREILSSQDEENNPLAKSIEELQIRLNDQQIANESLTNALGIKTQENETLTGDLTASLKKLESLQYDVIKLENDLKTETSARIQVEQTLSDEVQRLELQVKSITEEKSSMRQQLRMKELELKELQKVVDEINTNNLDLESLYEVSHIKAEAMQLLEERDELKIRLSDEEGAHQLLEEHVKLVKEEVAFLSEQCKIAEKEKKDTETRLEVLTKFFEEKEAQRQKEEVLWLEKQGEVRSTVERIQTMQNEILNYKQQIEMLKREIIDQEREYKNQISVIETKAHEQWVTARQNERRLEEAKVESSQLRNRLTLVEKNMNDGDAEVKLHRLQAVAANGETGPPGHPLFAAIGAAGSAGAEAPSSPLMFVPGAGGVPPLPPPPSAYLYGPPPPFPPPPFLPPPPPRPGLAGDLVGSRPPPLGGGRLSSPPPGSPPLSPPPPLMHFPHHPPPLPPFDAPLPSHRHPARLPPPHQQQGHAWGEEAPRYPQQPRDLQREQRASRNHKGSLHSSGESLDKSHHGKV